MEKEVESLKSCAGKQVIKDPKTEEKECKLIDGKELERLFENMTVSKSVTASKSANKWRSAVNKMYKIHPQTKFKRRIQRKKKKQPQKLKICLRPSKLNHVVASVQSAESRFSTFSADCSRELDTIAKCDQKDNVQKKRKASSCAQQARSECLSSAESVNLSIDILTDYLEETMLLPKKMSYMAELMYT